MASSILPADIFSLICDFCAPNQYLNLALTCKALHRNLTRRKYAKITFVELDLLKWAVSQGYVMNTWTSNRLAYSGDAELFKWAHTNGCPWGSWTCGYLAGEGYFDLLKWARKNGAPWDYWVCKYASRQGHLEMLQWAIANGCPWNYDSCILETGPTWSKKYKSKEDEIHKVYQWLSHGRQYCQDNAVIVYKK